MKLEYKDDLYRNQTFTSGEIGELEWKREMVL
jgi:hypothetical protein